MFFLLLESIFFFLEDGPHKYIHTHSPTHTHLMRCQGDDDFEVLTLLTALWMVLTQTLELTEINMRENFCSPCIVTCIAFTRNRLFFGGNLSSIICKPTTAGVQLLAQQLMQSRRENVMLEQALKDEKVISKIRKRVVSGRDYPHHRAHCAL